ncbi:MAG: ABC transporter ATP-binding protein [Candidatus Brocadia sp. AMX2]|uniref:ABC transporter ATP-binding protein n=1 Tax=Candidatus Brocadia sp. AMX2 TaxID=2293635 RepID=UPI000EE2E2EA|nr:ABC transporter ATP-binding protein [Candidatus Brocadia sp. AMX2]MBC6932271.1 ABC transporter ATP-binding protein [Candidatus Brocadia sp.]MBL1169768.1 ABC transporter ATP-binding protein [Candidatus Brocadia sp. AMX1]MCK6469316.1 ABC transporter ATP-binding protein/permease [Candidatus Brocadia sinica]NOG40399.1 ABC transporter ATP-binding protein [Planctomycetota bacterium]KAA0245108.1 MAG: ABC transporter ATP-binding protein [Candidatus Brocadia sp. AMX2]
MLKKLRGLWEKSIIFRVFVRKYKRYFIFGTISLIAVDIINIFPPLIIKKAVDILSKEVNLTKIAIFSGLFLLVSFCQGVCRYLWRMNFIGTSFRCDYDLRMAFFAHIETLSQRFFQKYKTGDLLSRATNDIGAVRMAVGPGLLIGLDAIFYFFVIPPIIIYLSPKLSFYTFLLMPLTPFIAYKIKDVIDRRFRDVQEHFSRISEKVQENISGIRVVKSFNMSRQEERIFLGLCKEFVKKNLKLAVPQSLLGPVFEYITYTGIILLLFIGGKMVIEEAITLGTLVAFQRYISMMVWPMTAIGWCLSLLQRGNASMKRIDEVMEEKPEIISKNHVAKQWIPSGEIEFRDVNFQYDPQKEWILKDIRLKIPAGKRIAIVGPIGSGKSTLVNMLPRIIPVNDQCIFIDGMDINTINVKILRQHIGFVPQDTFLFSEKITDNIVFGAETGGSDNTSRQFARIAGIEGEIQELPHRFESYLGERGINLSGGQKQRVTIARALAINPSIIILDDCLSAVDARVEDTIMKNILKNFPGRTLLVVTHRLPAIRGFDLIVVMKEGMIVERGTHEQLITANGLYTSLYTKEVLEERLG